MNAEQAQDVIAEIIAIIVDRTDMAYSEITMYVSALEREGCSLGDIIVLLQDGLRNHYRFQQDHQ